MKPTVEPTVSYTTFNDVWLAIGRDQLELITDTKVPGSDSIVMI